MAVLQCSSKKGYPKHETLLLHLSRLHLPVFLPPFFLPYFPLPPQKMYLEIQHERKVFKELFDPGVFLAIAY